MLHTPYYLVDKARLLPNMEKIAWLRERSGAKSLLALKCFATWSVFPFMSEYMDGTTSSSLYEVRLGREKFAGETHAYSVAWSDAEMAEVVDHCDKIIFNSVGQLTRFNDVSQAKRRGLRVNPGVSSSSFDLADPARPFSRLGEHSPTVIEQAMADVGGISGFMFHNNCENGQLERFAAMLDHIERQFGHLIRQMEWISLGGGISFTHPDYPLEAFAERLKRFAGDNQVQVYLEPGEAAVAGSTTLEVSVLDTLNNGKNLAIVDSSIEAHMLDLLVYRYNARIESRPGPEAWMVCGKSCLAGDVFGEFGFDKPLQVGDRLSIEDAAAYTMVKKNWFNGVKMPAIAVRELDGEVRLVRDFAYADFASALS